MPGDEDQAKLASNKRPHAAVDGDDENGAPPIQLQYCDSGAQTGASPWRRQKIDRVIGDSSSDDDFGPALPSADAPKKKRRKLPFEKVYVNALPASPRYSKSLMHKDQLSFTTMSPHTDFLITSSIDGFVKFWKKMAVGVEFVKEFRAHNGEVRSVSVSADGRSFATTGADKTVKIFDVITFGRWIFPGTLILPAPANLPRRSPGYAHRRVHPAMRLLGPSSRRIPPPSGCDR